MLARLLREEPTVEIIDAVSSVADEICIVQLGRIVRSNPTLASAAVDALESIDNALAHRIVATIRSAG